MINTLVDSFYMPQNIISEIQLEIERIFWQIC